MSQAKIDQRKKEKYDRKSHPSKQNTTSYGAYIGVGLFCVLFVVWIGYSILLQFNIIPEKVETTTYASEVTADELAEKLASYDPLGCYTTVASENDTTAAAEDTTAEDAEAETSASDSAEGTTAE